MIFDASLITGFQYGWGAATLFYFLVALSIYIIWIRHDKH